MKYIGLFDEKEDIVTKEKLEAVEAAMKKLDETPLYVVPVVGNGRPKLTASIPVSGAYAQVIKYTTMPNGEKAIK